MALRQAKPTSPGRRFVVAPIRNNLYRGRPFAALLAGKKNKRGGRNNQGRITCRHVGGGHKQLLRIVDFKRNKDDIPARVMRIEYDPGRSAFLALIRYKDGEYNYIIAAHGIKVGDVVISGLQVPIKVGNCLPLTSIPVGTTVYCVEMKKGKGAQLARSAGSSVQIVARDGEYSTLRLRSGEMRKIRSECRATVGSVGNVEHNLRSFGTAGSSRRRGIRPTVRGVAMNPIDHPHGGGEGKTAGGRHPVSPTGIPSKGYKTRRNKRTTKYIVKRRSSKRK